MGVSKFKILGKEQNLGNRRINDVIAEGTTSVLKELGGHNLTESKLMVDNIIAVTNCGSGAGASTIVSNLAYLLSSNKYNMNVLVLDLNIICPIQHIYFDKNRETSNSTDNRDLVDFLTGQSTIGESTVTDGSISIMYAVNRSVADEINCEGNMAVSNLRMLLTKVRDLYDVVIIDCPMRITNALANTAMYMADKIYAVWDEGLPSIVNTDRIMRQLGFTGIDSYAKMLIVMNKKTSVNYSKYPLEKLGLKLVGTLPFSTDVIYSSLDAQVYCASGKARNKNGGEFERAMIELADKVIMIGGKTKNSSLEEPEQETEEQEQEETRESLESSESSESLGSGHEEPQEEQELEKGGEE